MKIRSVTPRGYCKGVIDAISIAKKTAADNPNTPITMLGMIVHNKYVVEACKEIGIQCLDDPTKTRLELLDQIQDGIVIFTAHGVSDEVYKKAQEKQLTIVDATCIHVKNTHDLVKNHVKNGDVIYIGKRNHPEAEGVIALSDKIHFVTSVKDVEELPSLQNILITNQTTLSILDIQPIIDACLKKYPSAKLEKEICNATQIRQEAIMKLNDVDCLLVVGDPHSNNSNQLKSIAEANGIKKSYLVETVDDVDLSLLSDCETVAVTSGSSTPTYLTQQVIHYLETNKKEEVEISKIL